MAKISEKRLREVKDRILHSGSYMVKEAFEMGIPHEELIEQLERMYPGGRKNSQYKAVIKTSDMNASRVPEADLQKMQIMPKPTRKAKPAFAPTPAPTPAPIPAPIPAPTPADPMEKLLRKRDELQRELAASASSLEKAEAILAIRQGALTDAQAVLQKAEAAVQQAEAEEEDAKQAVRQAQAQQHETQAELQGVEKVIQELKEKTIYLVDPWFNGTLPEYGTFISTVEMEGVQMLKPVETIEPDFKDMVSSGFDLVSEYTRALSFVSLVQEYILKGEAHSVLNTDPRVKNLLDKHIG